MCKKEIPPAWCYFDGMGRPGWMEALRFTGGLPILRKKWIISFKGVIAVIKLQLAKNGYEF